ncbi:hypothetical protein AX17_003124 [Amanita inopinata Kibby_2008]|nr:hypothetical protein AX17_003124 [Amanita inopinata Kibby_2008]
MGTKTWRYDNTSHGDERTGICPWLQGEGQMAWYKYWWVQVGTTPQPPAPAPPLYISLVTATIAIMPMKHVRFARSNTYLAPPNPGLTSLSSSPASSTGPLTPPSHTFSLPGPTPYVFSSPQPKRRETHTRPHPLLEFSHSPAVHYDLMDPPSSVTSHHLRLSRALAEPATNPPVQSMTLVSPHLPWSIKVSAHNGTYVTVSDVLGAMYNSLRTNITPSEHRLLPTRQDQERAASAYRQRYRRHRDPRTHDAEKRAGMKRVDFLMGHSQFAGLSRTDSGPTSWFLNVR